MLTAVNANNFVESPLTASSAKTATGTASSTNSDVNASQDRFLKLLVAQLNNQDPMNPLDNAQMTSQMAQINTVTSVQQVNETLKGLASQFSALQMMQGSALVGHDVLVGGDTLALNAGTGLGAYRIDSHADRVTLEVLSPAGQVVDSQDLGAQDAGQHAINWDASAWAYSAAPRFRVSASGAGQNLSVSTYSRATVQGLSTDASGLQVQLAGRPAVAYSAVQAIY